MTLIQPRQVYTTHVTKFDSASNTWKPYSGLADMQLEFTMLDPHVRTSLPPVAGAPGTYSVTFRAPDRHGVFKFIVDYKRKGCASFCNIALECPLTFLFSRMQLDPPVQLDDGADRAPAPRRVPALPERGVAVLCWRDQHEPRLCAFLCTLVGG